MRLVILVTIRTVVANHSQKSRQFKYPSSLAITTIRSFTTSTSIRTRNYGCHRGVRAERELTRLPLVLDTGYTTKKPAQFKLQDDGSALAVAALGAVSGRWFASKESLRTPFVESFKVHSTSMATSARRSTWRLATPSIGHRERPTSRSAMQSSFETPVSDQSDTSTSDLHSVLPVR